jgi:putative heme-binding domain-containing protein
MRFCVAISLVIIPCAIPLFAEEGPIVAPTNWLSPADEKKKFHLPPGFEAQLVASEPEIMKPMQLAFDLKGRLWLCTSREYPFAAAGRPGNDRVMILSDFGPDGKARKFETFADGLNIPIGCLPLPDGKSVLVSSIDPGPDGSKKDAGVYIWKLTDTKGTGKADLREKLYGPFNTRDTHGMVNSFTLMPDGWVYACHGYLNDDTVKGRDGHEVHMQSGNIFRFRPDGSRIEVYTHGQVNPFGIAIDPWFNIYTADCHSKPITQLVRGGYYSSFGKPHDGMGFAPDMIRHDHGSTGLCGLCWYDAEHFPKEFHGMYLGNVVNSRINWDHIKFHGSTPEAIEQPDFLVSDDFWFRPVDIKLGPDNAMYVSDFYNKIIGHYEVPLNDPRRDRKSGRIWRIVYTGKDGKNPIPKPPEDLTKKNYKELDELLASPNITLRMQATIAIINLEYELSLVKKVDRPAVYYAHRIWAEEAEPIGMKRARADNKRYAIDDVSGLVATHQLRLQTAQAEWDADRHRRGQQTVEKRDTIEISTGGQVARAGADRMTAVPDVKNLPRLLEALKTVAADDTHLRHAYRIALRETLRDPAAFTALKVQRLDDNMVRNVADIMPGLPNGDAADYLMAHLSVLAADPGRLPDYIQHATRYGGGAKSIFAFVTTHKPDDVQLTSALFLAYQRAMQQKGGPRFDKADYDFAEQLVAKGVADSDPSTVQRCFDIAAGLKLKPSFEPIAKFALRKDRHENQRAAAFATLLTLDPGDAVTLISKVLADEADHIAAREKAAQALGAAGSQAALTNLVAALEKAPARMQTVIAASLAGRPEGAELLLKTIAAGKASGRLLQDRIVQTKLNESRLPKVNERIAELTKGLPTADQRMTELMNKRREGYAKVKTDPKLGALVFKNSCGNCHQMHGEGAKVGPQLDGIGGRGLDRLLEDILDPSRNVDQAFRSTVLYLKDSRTVSGLVLREEGEVIVMADQQGKDVRIPKADVEDRKISLLSPMPANLAETIKEEDFHNLMAYLLQQKAKDK